MEGKYFVAGCSIIAIGALGTVALYKGINGTVTALAFSSITFIVGVCFGIVKGQKS